MHKQSVSFAAKSRCHFPMVSDYQALNPKHHTFTRQWNLNEALTHKTWDINISSTKAIISKAANVCKMSQQHITLSHTLLKRKQKVFKKIKAIDISLIYPTYHYYTWPN